MKLSCLQESLSTRLAIVGRAVAGRAAEVHNSNVLLATNQGQLDLMSNSGQTCIKTRMGAMIEEDGEVIVPHRLLSDLINTLPSDRVDLELETREEGGTVLHIACSRAAARMEAEAKHVRPVEPEIDNEFELAVRGSELGRTIQMVVFSAADSGDRPMMTGICMEGKGEQIRMVTTDGHRLTLNSCRLIRGLEEEQEFRAVPNAAAMREVARIMGQTDEQVRITLSNSGGWMSFEDEQTVIKTQLIRGTYPSYEALIPQQWTTRATMEANDLKRASQTASVFANAGSNIIRLELAQREERGGQMTVSSRSDDVGNNKGEIDLLELEGEDNKVAINVRYLSDVIATAGRDKLIMEMTNASSPIVFRCTALEDWSTITMPMFVQW